jgi:hypothetical protein
MLLRYYGAVALAQAGPFMPLADPQPCHCHCLATCSGRPRHACQCGECAFYCDIFGKFASPRPCGTPAWVANAHLTRSWQTLVALVYLLAWLQCILHLQFMHAPQVASCDDATHAAWADCETQLAKYGTINIWDRLTPERRCVDALVSAPTYPRWVCPVGTPLIPLRQQRPGSSNVCLGGVAQRCSESVMKKLA